MPTTPCSFRPDDELHTLLEMRAYKCRMTKAELIEAAVRAYLQAPAPTPLRHQLEALLFEMLLCKAYSHSLARLMLGDEVVRESLPEVEREARAQVKSLFNRLATIGE